MFLETISQCPATVFAYIGPGGGLSAIGALIALFAVLTLAFLGFVWYPVKRLRRKLRTPEPDSSAPHGSPVHPKPSSR